MAPSLWDGTLSIDDFNASAKALMTKWREIDVEDSLPDWTWKPCCTMGVASQVMVNGLGFLTGHGNPVVFFLYLTFEIRMTYICFLFVLLQVEGFLALEGVFHTGAGSQVGRLFLPLPV